MCSVFLHSCSIFSYRKKIHNCQNPWHLGPVIRSVWGAGGDRCGFPDGLARARCGPEGWFFQDDEKSFPTGTRSGWWQLKHWPGIFTLIYLGMMIQFDEQIFLGVWNHQLEIFRGPWCFSKRNSSLWVLILVCFPRLSHQDCQSQIWVFSTIDCRRSSTETKDRIRKH